MDDKRKKAEQKAAEAAQAEQEYQQAESIAAQHSARLNNLDERIAQCRLTCSNFDEVCKYTTEEFTRDFLNDPKRVGEFAARLTYSEKLILKTSEIKKNIEQFIVAPHRKSLADFESQHRAILKTLPKPERKPEPAFVPTKLEPDFYVSGKSSELVKKFQS